MDRKILIVDDEADIREILQFNLEIAGYEVECASSAEEALEILSPEHGLILLDVMMGEISGFELAKTIKSSPATASIPIIFCTARDTEDDMIEGLDLGADDYVMKPYSLRNVLARVRTVLRRVSPQAQQASEYEQIIYDGIVIDTSKKQCSIDGEVVAMPRKEFEILFKLITNRGKIFSREELLQSIWTDEVVVVDRVVDVNINRIRQKLGRYSKNIVTRTGYGYGFME